MSDIDTVYRDHKVKGDIHSGEHQPDKPEIRALLKRLQDAKGITRNTLAALNAVTPPDETYMGIVLTGAGAGYYSRSGGAWVFGRPFPDTFAKVVLSGSGTSQTGAVSAGVNPAGVEVFFAKVATPNTGPLTLSISGEPARQVINLAGNPLSAGEWTDMVMFSLNDANQYQLLVDAGAAASAAQSATNAAASAVAAAAFGSVNFDTVADLLSDDNSVIGYVGSGASVVVAAGFVLTAQGFRYEVAASGASDHDVETAGGVKLYALSRQGPLYQNIAEMASQEQPGATENLQTIAYNQEGVAGSGSVFTDAGFVNPSVPGQMEVEVAGATRFYTRSNKVLRPQQHGVKTGGSAAVNRAGLIEMLNLANYTGHEIDMGDARDVYEIATGISHTFTKKPIIRGSGATIKLNKAGGAVSQYALRLLHDQLGFDLEGFNVDANYDAPYALSIENTRTGALDEGTLKDGRLVGIGGHRGYTRTDTETGTRGINVTGWLRHLHAAGLRAEESLIAAGAYNLNYSTAGIFIGRNSSGAYILFKDIIDPFVGKVHSEDQAQTLNMDAILIYDAIPANGLVRPIGSTSIRGGMLRDFWGRGVKIQALNVDIVGLNGDLASAPTGDQCLCFLDFQFGGGNVQGGSLRCNGKSPKNIVVSQSQSYSAAQTTIRSLQISGTTGTPEPDSIAWRYPETGGRIDGGMVVRDCSTRTMTVKNIARWSSRSASAVSERVSVEGNMVGVTSAAVAFEFFGAEPLAATIKDNLNLTTTPRTLYTRKTIAGSAVTNTVDVKGTASDNWYFVAGT